MPAPMFMRGAAPWRNTLAYLESGKIIFRPIVKILTLNYTLDKPDSDGLRRFIFWHLAQIQYKNPQVQCVQFKNTTPTPFVSFYLTRSTSLNNEENSNEKKWVIIVFYHIQTMFKINRIIENINKGLWNEHKKKKKKNK